MNLCEVCNKRNHTKLCDFATESGIISSSRNFSELTSTCDKKLCDKCAVNIWAECDVCPDHAEEIKNNLSISQQGGRRKVNWSEYKKSITSLSEDEKAMIEQEAKELSGNLGKDESNEKPEPLK
ncbi:hypothetical protein [Rossellomorea vietnamensis]|uniref:hypothetical protein n=1 Tax=Rossellomorea vietnamensis TaxID=218284 RepID=UPI00054F149E|nr:hypothetical protein [Rossellomorea vietnamensis]